MIPRRRVCTGPRDLGALLRAHRSAVPPGDTSIAELERAIAELTGMPHAAAVSSGRRAMALVLGHLGVGPGYEVIVPAWTLGALVPLIQATGATVVPADIEGDTFQVDVKAIRRRQSDRTAAIIALHAFGAPCRIDRIAELAAAHDVPLIEDCAHSLGATLGGRQTGSFGYAGFFSFETTKLVNTYGGGMVVTRDPDLVEAIRSGTRDDVAQVGGVTKKLVSVHVERALFATGLAAPMLWLLASPRWKGAAEDFYRRFQHAPASNLRYLPAQAAIGLRKLEGLPERIARRRRLVERLCGMLDETIRPQVLVEDSTTTWYFLVVRVPGDVGQFRRRLLRRGIDVGIRDEIADDTARALGFDDCPVVAEVFESAVVLPLWDGMGERTLERVGRGVARGVRGTSGSGATPWGRL